MRKGVKYFYQNVLDYRVHFGNMLYKIDLKIEAVLLYYLNKHLILFHIYSSNSHSKMASKPVVLSVADWVVPKIKYMPPKVNERGGKSINIISAQTNRALAISTPMMMTWGVADFIGDNGESDGKFSISLVFPNDEYRKPSTDAFLQKLKDFENQILDDAVKNSELWWGEEMSREVCKHTSFPSLKYSKNKETKKIDMTKPPTIRAKVPNYGGKWNVEIYDTTNKQIFPCENENLTPIDFVPKQSNVACVLQCGGIWIGGKGWGVTWKLIQCVVKPREVVSIYGKCHIQLSEDERGLIEGQQINEDEDVDEPIVAVQPKPAVKAAFAPVPTPVPVPTLVPTPVPTPAPVPVPVAKAFDTSAADSDDEAVVEVNDEPEEEAVEEPAPVVAAAAPVAAKKVIKKAAPVPAPVPVASTEPAPTAAKKIVKKKVV